MKNIMMRSLSTLMALVLLVTVLLTAVACGETPDPTPGPGECTSHVDSDANGKCDNCDATVEPPACVDHTDADGNRKCDKCGADVTPACTSHVDEDLNGKCDVCDAEVEVPETLREPVVKDYGRETIDFADYEYVSPDTDAILAALAAATTALWENNVSYEEIGELLIAADDLYVVFDYAYPYANVMVSLDASKTEWGDEYTRLSTVYPDVIAAFEDLYEAAANSPHVEALKEDYFGPWLDDYKDGGRYNDETIALMKQEAELETRYESMSTANIVITYGTMTDTVDNILAYYKEALGEESDTYKQFEYGCMGKYEEEVDRISREIFVELFKVRSQIAAANDQVNFLQFAFDEIGHDYSIADAKTFLDGIANYVAPVYQRLSAKNGYFDKFFQQNKAPKIERISLINDCYEIMNSMNEEYGDVYNFMMLYNMYSIEKKSTNREDGAFVTMMDGNDSPYLFVTMTGKSGDYSTLCHEFGHFMDMYYNGSTNDLNMAEIFSQANEFLILGYMDGILEEKDVEYLKVMAYQSALEVMYYQGFYAMVEYEMYSLPYDMITEENLANCIVKAAEKMGFANASYYNDIGYVFIPHLFLYPCYVQSYATSITAAISINRMESEQAGAGMQAYYELLHRNEQEGRDPEVELAFVEYLAEAGIPSPFAEGTVQDLADYIYYTCTGSHFNFS